jgi:hypothetical protein
MSSRGEVVDGSRRTVGRYEIVREIGRGGMATVFVAQQLDLERRVALKELRALGALDPSFAQRFLREARLAGSLSHPNIVTVHDYFEHERVPYIAMEYLARGSLRPYLGRLTLPQIGGVLEGLLAGLTHAERHEVVHRDIKPENLLVTLEGGIKIADFGIAKATHALETSSMTAIGTTVGTPNYIAPEQAMARRLGPWTDLYSVGIAAFELLVGRTPFGDTEEPMGIVLRQINEPVPRVSDLVPNVDPWISDWVGWLVSKAPADRPQSAAQAWDALDEALLRLLGPRWRRDAPLLTPADQTETAPGQGTAPRVGGAGAAAAVGFGAAEAIRVAQAGGGGLSPAPTWSERTKRPTGDPLFAPTMPPRQQVAGTRPPASNGRPRRILTAFKAASIVATLVAAAAIALSAHHGGLMAPASEETKQTGLKAAPTQAASAQPQTPSADAPLADQVAPARQLALAYDRSASQISARSQNGSLSGADAVLVSALRRTSSSYRAAAAAAARGDLAGYSAALAAAATSRQQVSRLLDGAPGGGSSASPAATPTPMPTPRPASSCAGDSTSDDPSDDSCGAA